MDNPRKAREAELARTAFVDAGIAVLGRKGLHGATMDEIARTAGYSPGAIYRYFKTKDDVMRAVLQRISECFVAQANEEPPVPLRFADRLRWWLVRHFEEAEKRHDLFAAYLEQRIVHDEEIRTKLGEEAWSCHLGILEALRKLMERGIAEGALRPGDALDYARAFHGLMRGLTSDWCSNPEAPPLSGRVDLVLDLFMRGAGA